MEFLYVESLNAFDLLKSAFSSFYSEIYKGVYNTDNHNSRHFNGHISAQGPEMAEKTPKIRQIWWTQCLPVHTISRDKHLIKTPQTSLYSH